MDITCPRTYGLENLYKFLHGTGLIAAKSGWRLLVGHSRSHTRTVIAPQSATSVRNLDPATAITIQHRSVGTFYSRWHHNRSYTGLTYFRTCDQLTDQQPTNNLRHDVFDRNNSTFVGVLSGNGLHVFLGGGDDDDISYQL